MIQYKDICLKLQKTPNIFCILYNLYQYVHNRYVYTEVKKGIYKLQYEGIITHVQVVEFLEPFGYALVSVT